MKSFLELLIESLTCPDPTPLPCGGQLITIADNGYYSCKRCDKVFCVSLETFTKIGNDLRHSVEIVLTEVPQ